MQSMAVAPMPVRQNHDFRIDVVYRRLDELKLNPKNARQHSRKQVGQIAESMRTFGTVLPVVLDPEDTVIIGNGRVLAGRKLGFCELPTVKLKHLTPAQFQALAIADNRLAENSVWDDRILAEQLNELSAVDLGFSIEITGFDIGEIDVRIEALNGEADGNGDLADDIPSIPSKPPVTRPGDLWLLGPHRLYCGSALDPAAYATLMHGALATMIFTDPPYNVRIDGHASGLGAIRHREFAMASGEMDETEFKAFLTSSCALLTKNSIDGAIHFVCMDWRHIYELMTVGREIYSELKNICVWVKNNGGMGSFYRSRHELVLVFKQGGGSHRNNVQLGRFGRNRTNVWEYPGANSLGRGTEEGNLLALHPTVKPAAMVADAILDCSARGDVILDAFLGSGTTVIAAERTGRRCYGLELEPGYADTIIRRWQAFTGRDARHAASGRSFDELSAAREPSHAAK
jgi:DNA modification methylase